MKIELKNGALTATAETVADVRTIMGLIDTPKTVSAPSKKAVSKQTCPVCGKRVIMLLEHVNYNHSPKVAITKLPD